MSIQARLIFWFSIAASIIAFLVVFNDVLLPFVLGAGIAYLLNPIVYKLSRGKLTRKLCVLIILLSFFAFLFLILALISPILYRELSGLAEDIPRYVDQLLEWIKPYSDKLSEIVASDTGQEDIKKLLGQSIEPTMNFAKIMLEYLSSSGQAVGGFLTTLIFTPIVAYFMMNEWNKIADWTTDLFPRNSKQTMMDLLKDIDKKLSGFVRGQIMVALALAVIYSLALTLAGLKYGFLIGLVSGLLSIIPMVGTAIGFVVSVSVAIFQTGAADWSFVALIAGIFIAGQVIEGNFLTPKLVGESVGLHPLWVFFALLAGGAVMGITGMFLAVPIVAVTGVLIAHGIKQYKASPLYKGKEPIGAPKQTGAKKPVKKK